MEREVLDVGPHFCGLGFGQFHTRKFLLSIAGFVAVSFVFAERTIWYAVTQPSFLSVRNERQKIQMLSMKEERCK